MCRHFVTLVLLLLWRGLLSKSRLVAVCMKRASTGLQTTKADRQERIKKALRDIDGVSYEDLQLPVSMTRIDDSFMRYETDYGKERLSDQVAATYVENPNRLLWSASGAGKIFLVKRAVHMHHLLAGSVIDVKLAGSKLYELEALGKQNGQTIAANNDNDYLDDTNFEKFVYNRQYRWSNGMTAMHIAAKFNHHDVARILIKGGWDPFALDDNNKTPQAVALAHGHTDLATWLGELKVESNISIAHTQQRNIGGSKLSKGNALSKMYNEGLYWAVMDSNYDIVKEALENNIVLESSLQYPQYRLLDINDKVVPGTNGHQESVEFDGYTPNYKHVSCGWTALHVAASFDDEHGLKLTRLLMRHGWNPLEKDNSGFSPIDVAKKMRATDTELYMRNVLRQGKRRR